MPTISDDPYQPSALDGHRAAGWEITGSVAAWIATRVVGSAFRVIAANSARELLRKLGEAEERDGEERRPVI
jgi:hypothetical protein